MPGPGENPLPLTPEQHVQEIRTQLEAIQKQIQGAPSGAVNINPAQFRQAFEAARKALPANHPSITLIDEAMTRIGVTPGTMALPLIPVPQNQREAALKGLTQLIATLNGPLPSERELKAKEYIQKVRGDLAALRQKIEADRKAQNLTKEESEKKGLDDATKKQIEAVRKLIEDAPAGIRDERAWKEFSEETLKEISTTSTLTVAQAQEQLQKLAPDMPAADPRSVMADNIDARLSQLVQPNGPLAPMFQMLQKQIGMSPEAVTRMVLDSVRSFFANFLTGIKLPDAMREVQDNIREQGVALKWRMALQQEIRQNGAALATATVATNPLGGTAVAIEAQQASLAADTQTLMQRLSLDAAARNRYFDCYMRYLAAKDGGNTSARPPLIANIRTEDATKQYRDTLTTAPASTPTTTPEAAPIGGLVIPAAGIDVGTTESKITHDSKEIKFVKSNTNENEYRISFGTAPNARSVLFRVAGGNVTSTKLLRPESGNATGDVRVQLNGQTAVKLSEVVTKMESDTNTPRRTHLKIENGNLTLES